MADSHRPNCALICGIFTTTREHLHAPPPMISAVIGVTLLGVAAAQEAAPVASRVANNEFWAPARRPRPPRERAPDHYIKANPREALRGRCRDFTQKRASREKPRSRPPPRVPARLIPHSLVSRSPCRLSFRRVDGVSRRRLLPKPRYTSKLTSNLASDSGPHHVASVRSPPKTKINDLSRPST